MADNYEDMAPNDTSLRALRGTTYTDAHKRYYEANKERVREYYQRNKEYIQKRTLLRYYQKQLEQIAEANTEAPKTERTPAPERT